MENTIKELKEEIIQLKKENEELKNNNSCKKCDTRFVIDESNFDTGKNTECNWCHVYFPTKRYSVKTCSGNNCKYKYEKIINICEACIVQKENVNTYNSCKLCKNILCIKCCKSNKYKCKLCNNIVCNDCNSINICECCHESGKCGDNCTDCN